MSISYRVIRSARKTLSLQITPEGEVLVRCPNRMPDRTVDDFVRRKQHWIESHLAALPPAVVPLTPGELEALRRRAGEILPERVRFYAGKLGISYSTVSIRCQRTRWGSCSSRGNLSFNALLMCAPEDVVDYVVVHELCHRLEMNHSPRFWARVAEVLPEYQQCRNWLRENGSGLIARLPKSGTT